VPPRHKQAVACRAQVGGKVAGLLPQEGVGVITCFVTHVSLAEAKGEQHLHVDCNWIIMSVRKLPG